MTDAVAKPGGADEAVMHSIADAMKDAATAASEHADKVKPTASEAGTKALETISQMFYTSSYVLAYGVVYAAVFIAQSLPQENSVIRGFRDGGQAAALPIAIVVQKGNPGLEPVGIWRMSVY